MKLTKSEREIIKHMQSGLTFRQIAKETHSSVTDVARQMNELYTKFTVCDRVSFLEKVYQIDS